MKKIKLNRSRLALLAGLGLIVLGVVGVSPTLYYHWSNRGSVTHHGPLAVAAQTKPAPTVISGHPVSLSIPSLKMNLPVIDGYYNTNTKEWTLTLNKTQFATPSVQPNNTNGNTLIYGHYRPEVFAYLHLIKPGSQAIVTTNNGYRFSYQYVGSYATAPNDTSVLTYQGPPILTLQTCSGAWFQNRQMYQFNLVSYQKV